MGFSLDRAVSLSDQKMILPGDALQMGCQSVTRLRSPNPDGMEVEASGYRNCHVISVIMVDGIVFTCLKGHPKDLESNFKSELEDVRRNAFISGGLRP